MLSNVILLPVSYHFIDADANERHAAITQDEAWRVLISMTTVYLLSMAAQFGLITPRFRRLWLTHRTPHDGFVHMWSKISAGDNARLLLSISSRYWDKDLVVSWLAEQIDESVYWGRDADGDNGLTRWGHRMMIEKDPRHGEKAMHFNEKINRFFRAGIPDVQLPPARVGRDQQDANGTQQPADASQKLFAPRPAALGEKDEVV